MLFKIYPRRCEGWLMPRFRAAFIGPFVGHLSITEEHEPSFFRHILIARLLDPVTKARMNQLPALYDVSLVSMQTDYFAIRGFERIPNDLQTRTTDYAQSWLVEPVDHSDLAAHVVGE